MEIDASIAENGGSSYCIVFATLNQHKQKFKVNNKDLLYNYKKQATRELQLPPHEVSLQSACESQTVSGLTFDHAANGNIHQQDEDKPKENLTYTLENEQSRNHGGRPEGATNEALHNIKFKVRLALNWAAIEFERVKGYGRRQWRIYDKIIRQTNEKFSLPEKHWLITSKLREQE